MPRVASLELVLGLAAFAALAWPRRSRLATAGRPTVQALELRVEEQGHTQTVRTTVPATIGRQAGATVVLTDANVSRLHARIDASEEGPMMRDLGSRNGTMINGRPIGAPQVLVAGDQIDVGLAHIVIERID